MIGAWHSDKQTLASQRRLIDELVFGVAGIEESDTREALEYRSQFPDDVPDDGRFVPKQPEATEQVAVSLVSFALGHAFGRWNIRALQQSESSQVDLFVCPSPGIGGCSASFAVTSEMLGRQSVRPKQGHWALLDDDSDELDVIRAIESAFGEACGRAADDRLEEVINALGSSDLRLWFSTRFFEEHMKLYTATRRRAPVYWQLTTASSSYSVWLYYHRLGRDTLFRLLNDHIVPKLGHEERKLSHLTRDAGTHPSSDQRKEIDSQEDLAAELRAFRDEVSRVAPLWNPDLNDGVMINFAPLWRLVPHLRVWQKECRATWDKLCRGNHDWAHLAMHLWPERVVPKCAEDRSLAIAHSLEDVFWYEDMEGKWLPRKVEQDEIGKLVQGRSSAAVKDALASLFQAPGPALGRSPKRKTRAKRTVRRPTSSIPKDAAINGAPRIRSPYSGTDDHLLSRVKEVIAANGLASRSDVIRMTGITSSEWNRAIKALVADGSVTQTGQRRGARYQVEKSDA